MNSQYDTDRDEVSSIISSPNETMEAEDSFINLSVNGTYETENSSTHFKDFRKKHPKSIIIGHLNVNSVRYKFAEIADLLQNGFLDICGLSETKLDENFTNSQFHVENFSLYRKDRNGKGGGLLSYIRSDIPHRRRADLEYSKNGIESMIFEVHVKKEKWMVAIVYRSPSVNTDHLYDAMNHITTALEQESRTFFILGDLNVNLLKDNKEKHDFVNFLDVYDMSNVIRSPTCFKGENPTLIDVILTNSPKRIAESTCIDTGISDFHNMILISTKVQLPRPVNADIKYRSYKSFNEGKFIVDLEAAPFHVAGIFDDIDDAVWFHDTLLKEVIDRHAPQKRKRARPNQAPFINGELRRAINVKRTLRKLSKKYKNKWEAYRVQRNKVTSLRKKSIKQYFNDRCDPSNNKKSFWNTIRPFLTDKNKGGKNGTIILMENDNLYNAPDDICNIFNNFFASVADQAQQNVNTPPNQNLHMHSRPNAISDRMKDRNVSHFEFQTVTKEQVLSYMKKLNPKKATGPDEIPPKLLKVGAKALAPSVTNVINMSIKSAKFPTDMKRADVYPIYKKSDSMNKCNYRPVSVLSSLSKIFEGLMNDQMVHFFNDVLSSLLCAFRKNYSCQSLLFKIIENWKSALDNHEYVGVILMDLSKAFDCLPHDLLLQKLRSYGLSENACNLLGSYLRDRKQRVKYGGTSSEWADLFKGVPQGSILGPLLFNIFMNDFLYVMEGHCSLYNYADDNTLSFHDHDLQNVKLSLENAANIGIKWFIENNMKANPDKFQAMILSPSFDRQIENDFCFEIDGVTIKPERCVKLLGVYIDDKLKFHDHVSHICRQAAKQISVLRRFSNILSEKEKLQIFNAFILSNFNYCPLVWHLCGPTLSFKMEKTQERALRFVYNDPVSAYPNLLIRAKKPSLYLSRIRTLSIEVYKILNNISPPFLNDTYVKKETNYDLRDNNKLQQPDYKTITYGKNSLRYQGAKLWNNLPPHIKESTNVNHFKKLIKAWLGPSCSCSMCILCQTSS